MIRLFLLFCLILPGSMFWQNGMVTAQPPEATENVLIPVQQEFGRITIPTDRISSDLRSRIMKKGTIYRCAFDRESDINEDNWPDGWIRHEGIGFPKYYHDEMEIVKQRTLMGDQYFRIRIQRGNATVFSPRIPVLQEMTYTASIYVFANQLTNDQVYLSLSLLDADGKVLKNGFSEPVGNTEGWYQLTVPPMIADVPGVQSVALGLHVRAGDPQDIQGIIGFAQAMIAEFPTVRFEAVRPWNMFPPDEPVTVQGVVSMVFPSGEPATLTLFDSSKNELAKQTIPTLVPKNQSKTTDSPQKRLLPPSISRSENMLPEVTTIPFSWRVPIDSSGFYQARIFVPSTPSVVGSLPTDAQGETSFVVLPALKKDGYGFFGWTFSKPLTIGELMQLRPLLEQGGISRVKFPLWFSKDTDENDWVKMVEFCGWLAERRIIPVGVLHPSLSESRQINSDFVPAVQIFSQPFSTWYSSVEMNLFRLGMLVPDWQFGDDRDRSMEQMITLDQWIRDMKTQLEQNGLDIAFGFPWDWVRQFPAMPNGTERSRREFLALGSDFPLTGDDLEYYLDASQSEQVRRFVTLEPLDAKRYPMEERIRDLALRMVTAKSHGADGIFLQSPIDDQQGIYRENMTPQELFLPWRTVATLIDGKRSAPSVGLPGRSRNLCFRNKEETEDIFVLWSETPKRETLNFGNNAQVIDLWGKEITVPISDYQMTVDVGPTPFFVVDADPKISKIRQSFRLETSVIPGIYDQKNPNRMIMNNPFPVPLSGNIELIPPEGVVAEPSEFSFALNPSETLEKELLLTLTSSAMSGSAIFQAKVTLDDDDSHEFGVYQELVIGATELSIEPSTRINRSGQLEVHQAFINNGAEEVSFSCTLYTPDRPMQKIQVRRAGFGRRDSTYVVENGEALIGKPLRIVAREINGKRVLKYQFTAKE